MVDLDKTTPGAPPRRILYCHCAHARVVPAEVKAAVLEGLAASGVAFDAVPDLCELAARHDPALVRLAGGETSNGTGNGTADDTAPSLDIVACYPRAVRWLFHAADTPLPVEGVRVHNMRVDDAETLLTAVLDPAIPGKPSAAPTSETDSETHSETTDDSEEGER